MRPVCVAVGQVLRWELAPLGPGMCSMGRPCPGASRKSLCPAPGFTLKTRAGIHCRAPTPPQLLPVFPARRPLASGLAPLSTGFPRQEYWLGILVQRDEQHGCHLGARLNMTHCLNLHSDKIPKSKKLCLSFFLYPFPLLIVMIFLKVMCSLNLFKLITE